VIYGEHLSTEEMPVKCPCGEAATVDVRDKFGQSYGWFCRRCSCRQRDMLRRREKLARTLVRKSP